MAKPAIVINGHTLALDYGAHAQILATSVLRGSPWDAKLDWFIPIGNHRPATRADFDAFRVQWHPDYIVAD